MAVDCGDLGSRPVDGLLSGYLRLPTDTEPRWLRTWTARLPPRRTGFDPRPGHSGYSQVGNVADDVAGRQVYSGISRFPRLCNMALLHFHLISPSSALKISLLRAAQLSQLNYVLHFIVDMTLSSSLPSSVNCTGLGHTIVKCSFTGAELPGDVSNKVLSNDKQIPATAHIIRIMADCQLQKLGLGRTRRSSTDPPPWYSRRVVADLQHRGT
ncbi:hypothetical protein PR048_028891 [Dryococelus australis]|uniref:Uncharacterized protein n=1 Tax=Dryococelus australis TaxID=614101 RepID=A0ABQ9GCF9_9NEOP|nr:hypothetical protein PR048_028891 [Dryococelus australis]